MSCLRRSQRLANTDPVRSYQEREVPCRKKQNRQGHYGRIYTESEEARRQTVEFHIASAPPGLAQRFATMRYALDLHNDERFHSFDFQLTGKGDRHVRMLYSPTLDSYILGPSGRCVKFAPCLLHQVSINVSSGTLTLPGGIMFENLSRFLTKPCPRYKGILSEYATTHRLLSVEPDTGVCELDSDGELIPDTDEPMFAMECFDVVKSDTRFLENTNVIQHSVTLGGKPLINHVGEVELAWQTHQQDFVILNSEYHLLSPMYSWWTYLSRDELPLFQSQVMDMPCSQLEHQGKRMRDIVKYGIELRSFSGMYTPEIVCTERNRGSLCIFFIKSRPLRREVQIHVGAGVETEDGKKAIITEIALINGAPCIRTVRRVFGTSDFHVSVLRDLMDWQVFVSETVEVLQDQDLNAFNTCITKVFEVLPVGLSTVENVYGAGCNRFVVGVVSLKGSLMTIHGIKPPSDLDMLNILRARASMKTEHEKHRNSAALCHQISCFLDEFRKSRFSDNYGITTNSYAFFDLCPFSAIGIILDAAVDDRWAEPLDFSTSFDRHEGLELKFDSAHILGRLCNNLVPFGYRINCDNQSLRKIQFKVIYCIHHSPPDETQVPYKNYDTIQVTGPVAFKFQFDPCQGVVLKIYSWDLMGSGNIAYTGTGGSDMKRLQREMKSSAAKTLKRLMPNRPVACGVCFPLHCSCD